MVPTPVAVGLLFPTIPRVAITFTTRGRQERKEREGLFAVSKCLQ